MVPIPAGEKRDLGLLLGPAVFVRKRRLVWRFHRAKFSITCPVAALCWHMYDTRVPLCPAPLLLWTLSPSR